MTEERKYVRRHIRIGRFRLYYLVPYIIIIALFAFIAFRLNESQNESCVATAKNTVVINQFLDLLIDFAHKTPNLTLEQVTERTQAYNALKAPIPSCYNAPPGKPLP